MANTNRHSQSYLAHLSDNSEALYQEGLEPLLRYVDANSPLHERIGYSVTLKQDPLRLGQTPLLHFHASPFSAVVKLHETGLYKVKNVYWGMFGSNGPLPLHFTEFAIERSYRYNDKTLTEFCDLFHHRFLSLFYRSWAESQPTVSYDRPERDLFSKRIASFSGHLFLPSVPSASGDGFKAERLKGKSLSDEKRFLAGLLSMKNKSAGALAQVLSEYVQQDIQIQSFEGEWFTLPEDSQCRLGKKNAQLGVDCVLGNETFQRGFNYSIFVGPLTYPDYLYLVNNTHHFKTMQKLAVHHVGLGFSFTIKLLLQKQDIQGATLGSQSDSVSAKNSILGKNSWLGNHTLAEQVRRSKNREYCQHSPTTKQIPQAEQASVVYQYAC